MERSKHNLKATGDTAWKTSITSIEPNRILLRGYPLLSLAGTVFIAGLLYWRWVRMGRPAGLSEIESRID